MVISFIQQPRYYIYKNKIRVPSNEGGKGKMELSKMKTPRNPSKVGSQVSEVNQFQSLNETQGNNPSVFDTTKRREKRDEIRKNTIIEKLAAATTETQAAVSQATRNVNELQVAVQEIAASAQEASKAAQESLRAIQEIEKVAKVADERTGDLLNSITNLQTLIQSVSDEIEEMIRGVEAAAQVSLESAENVLQLERDLSRILCFQFIT